MRKESDKLELSKDYDPHATAETFIDIYNNAVSDQELGKPHRGSFLYTQRRHVIQILKESETPDEEINETLRTRLNEDGRNVEFSWAISRLEIYVTDYNPKKVDKYLGVLRDINR